MKAADVEMNVREAGESKLLFRKFSNLNLFDLLCRCSIFGKHDQTELECDGVKWNG